MMNKKFKKKISYELELKPPRSLSSKKMLRSTFNSHDEDISFVDVSLLDELKEMENGDRRTITEIRQNIKDPLEKRNILRYGQNISIDDNVQWALTLLSRATSIKTKSRETISNLLSYYIESLKYKEISPDIELKEQDMSDEIHLNQAILLTRICYLGDEDREDLRKIFLPDMTYHPIPIIRSLLLFFVAPELLDPDEELSLIIFFNLDLNIEKKELYAALKNLKSADFYKGAELLLKTIGKWVPGKLKYTIKKETNEGIASLELPSFLTRKFYSNALMIEALSEESLKRLLKRLKICIGLSNSLGKIDLGE